GDGRRRHGDGAAGPLPHERGPCVSDRTELRGDLVAAGRIHLVGGPETRRSVRGGGGTQRPLAHALLRMVEDHLLIQLCEIRHRGPHPSPKNGRTPRSASRNWSTSSKSV